MCVDDEYPEAFKLLMPSGGQSQPIRDAATHLVWTGDDVERQGEIGHGSRHRSDNGKIDLARQWRTAWRRMPTYGHETPGRFVCADATIVRWRPQRAADVRPERQRSKAGGERRG